MLLCPPKIFPGFLSKEQWEGGSEAVGISIERELDRSYAACSHLRGAWAAGFQLAVLALEDVPVRPAMAYAANPLDEGGFGLDQVERVSAVSRDGHGERPRRRTQGVGVRLQDLVSGDHRYLGCRGRRQTARGGRLVRMCVGGYWPSRRWEVNTAG